jgi:glyoxylase-like metal-dependent hydrolase (beta-lactamase superfamily II)
VILTHNHFDHAGGIAALKKRYGARVLAFVAGPGIDELIRDRQFVRAGDGFLEVIHTPGHSSDSICLYAPEPQAVFSGDTQLRTRGGDGGCDYTPAYLAGLERLASRKISYIYSGHDEPITNQARDLVLATLALVKSSGNQQVATIY